MCMLCSRRSLLAGFVTSVVAAQTTSATVAVHSDIIACAAKDKVDLKKDLQTMSSRSGNVRFDEAAIAELKRILRIIPVNPGFQYVQANNAYAVKGSFVRDSGGKITTNGTIFIGLPLVNSIMKKRDGGVSVAGILAHECAHIFQFQKGYYERLRLPQSTNVLVELHADALAGYYMAKRLDSSVERLAVLAETLRELASYDTRDPYFHGTPGQRHIALEKGYFLSRKGMSLVDAAQQSEKFVRMLVL